MGILGYILGFYRENGKEHGNYRDYICLPNANTQSLPAFIQRTSEISWSGPFPGFCCCRLPGLKGVFKLTGIRGLGLRD